jgi:hypothetical protein
VVVQEGLEARVSARWLWQSANGLICTSTSPRRARSAASRVQGSRESDDARLRHATAKGIRHALDNLLAASGAGGVHRRPGAEPGTTSVSGSTPRADQGCTSPARPGSLIRLVLGSRSE